MLYMNPIILPLNFIFIFFELSCSSNLTFLFIIKYVSKSFEFNISLISESELILSSSFIYLKLYFSFIIIKNWILKIGNSVIFGISGIPIPKVFSFIL